MDPHPISSDDEMPSLAEQSRLRSSASGPTDQAGVVPPAQLDEQVARLIQQKMAELLLPTSIPTK